MTQVTIDDIGKTVRDGVYIGIGLGVLAFQKAQVQRQELRKKLDANLDGARSVVEARVRTVEEQLEAVEQRIDTVLDDVEQRLPDQARAVMHQAREVAREARDQLVELRSR